MDEKPKRRWFQIRLSTVLILTAIAAWAMACRPALTAIYRGSGLEEARPAYVVVVGEMNRPPAHDAIGIALTVPVAAKWPALALAAFLAWKAAWAVVERRRRQSAATE